MFTSDSLRDTRSDDCFFFFVVVVLHFSVDRRATLN